MSFKNIYKWHRICSLIIAIPVLLWAGSGFMHPIMTNLRPAVNSQSIYVKPLDSSHIKLRLEQVLKQNHIDSIYSARLVHIDTNWFYQVKAGQSNTLTYISAKNGSILTKGDWLYAQYIARQFLEGANKQKHKAKQMDMPPAMVMTGMNGMADCCGEAANTVLNNKTGAPIESASLITKFDEEYKPIYCLLPVYKVSFKRADNIRLYVETGQDRFSIAVDKNRAAFTKFFDLVHTWGWIDFLGRGRIFVEIFFAGLGFVTALMGLYIFFKTKSKKPNGNQLVKARRNHRFTAIVAVVFTLMFTFSGCYHAFSKLGAPEKTVETVHHAFASADIRFDLHRLQSIVKKPIANIGIVYIDGKIYWQVYQLSATKQKKDLMKEMSATAPVCTYINATDYSILANGDEIYARFLAKQFSGYPVKEIVSTEQISKFTNEYNFTDKRLPVWKVNYPHNHNERLYVETSTGTLAKRTNDVELMEGYSFALFHKHHFWDFFGKTFRDASTMIGAGLQILMVTIGLILYFKWRNRNAKA